MTQLKTKQNRVTPNDEHAAGYLVDQLTQRGFPATLSYSTFSGWEVASTAPMPLMRALMPGAKLTLPRQQALANYPYRTRLVLK